MTRPLRRVHFLVWMFLCAGLSALFIASMRVRATMSPSNPQLHWETYP